MKDKAPIRANSRQLSLEVPMKILAFLAQATQGLIRRLRGADSSFNPAPRDHLRVSRTPFGWDIEYLEDDPARKYLLIPADQVRRATDGLEVGQSAVVRI